MKGTTIGFLFTVVLLQLLNGSVRSPVLLERQSGPRGRAEQVVARIIRADYEGDRPALARLERELAVLPEEPAIAPQVHYWRGFALWRRAINGFNDSAPAAELEADLTGAIARFEDSLKADPGFADAMIARLSCLGYLMYLGQKDPGRIQTLAAEYRPQAEALVKAAPDNPRLAWVLGPSRWYTAPGTTAAERKARQAAAIASYERGLAIARSQGRSADPLTPAWGEPELLMNLAWSHLNKTAPDTAAAEKYAREALALVPHWHYVRDILLPQIAGAKSREEIPRAASVRPATLAGLLPGRALGLSSLLEIVCRSLLGLLGLAAHATASP